tara:strand:+ start:51 stop:1250 length:1200 start_codon:yes stop_codon:yes gene_type:complete
MQSEFKNFQNNLISCSSPLTSIDPTQRAWIELSGNAIENNVREISSILKANCKFMAVVKADGYGHDAILVSEFAIRGGADQLGVATLQEGIHLRSAGIKIPILVLGNIYTKKDLMICFKNNLIPTISELHSCLLCESIGKRYQKRFELHLKIDTGMSRLGFDYKNFVENFNQIINLKNIHISGIYSHLASADEPNALNQNSFTQLQRHRFINVLNKINVDKYPYIKKHLSNSAGTFLSENFHFDMVRIGLSMYGYNPKHHSIYDVNLKPALKLKSKVTFIKNIDKDVGVSYGRAFKSNRKTKIAVIGIGYADGICRKLSTKIRLLHNGLYYPQIGSITMDQLMIDVTESNNIAVGDTVVLLGTDGNNSITPVDWADMASTIPWEILCSFKNRLPRVQVE